MATFFSRVLFSIAAVFPKVCVVTSFGRSLSYFCGLFSHQSGGVFCLWSSILSMVFLGDVLSLGYEFFGVFFPLIIKNH